MDTYIPIKKEVRNQNDKPLITKHFLELIEARQKAWNEGKNLKYRFYRNRVNRAAKTLRKQFYESKVQNLRKSNSKNWWKATKNLIGQNNNVEIASFRDLLNESCDNNPQTLANTLNDFLISVCRDIEPLPNHDEQDYNHIIEDEFLTTVEEVETKLAKIKLDKAIGPDKIPNWILRDFAPYLSRPLTSIFNASLIEKYIPEEMKSADIIPVPKKTPVKDIKKDIRPISLTPMISRILESIVRDRIRKYTLNKIDPNQYGGIPNSSTTTALIDMMHEWTKASENNQIVRVLLLDYSKAFDHVDHRILLSKLDDMNIPHTLQQWLRNFLTKRRQRVKFQKDVSSWQYLRGSVPQGSGLGGDSFVWMINDLSTPCRIWKFMDDTTLSETITTEIESKLQKNVDHVVHWSKDNHMNLNADKTKELIIDFRKEKMKSKKIVIEETDVEQVQSIKLLGLRITKDLKWKEHINHLIKATSKKIYYLKHLKRAGVPPEDLLLFYKSVIRSSLEYACPVWHTSLTKELENDLEKLQIRSLQIIFGEISNNTFQLHNIETLATRRDTLCRKLFHQVTADQKHKLSKLLTKPNCRNRKKTHYSTSWNRQT